MRGTPLSPARRIVARLRREEDGYAGTIIAVPVVIVFTFALFQFGLYYLGGEVAQAAAYNAFQQVRSYHAVDSDGVDAFHATLEANQGLLHDATVQITRPDADHVTVAVTGHPWAFLPFLPMPPINRTQTGPVERWVP